VSFELLDNVAHANLRIDTLWGRAGYGELNQVLAFATEFEALQRHFPIVFRRSENGPWRPVAILGLAGRENLFMDIEGKWDVDTYVPAAIRKGPLAIAQSSDHQGTPKVLIDPSHPLVSQVRGEPLFKRHGGNTAFLDHMVSVLGMIYDGDLQADALVDALEVANVLSSTNLHLRLGEGEIYAISDVRVVSTKALAELSTESLIALQQSGFLHHAHLAAASLGNLPRLGERKIRQRQDPQS